MSKPSAAGARTNGKEDPAQRAFAQFRQDMNNKQFRDNMAAMCPEEFRSVGYVDRLIESIFAAVRANPKLLTECDRASLFRSAERIAKKALWVGDNVAWLVPYNGQVEDQLGYKGAMIQVRRSGVPILISCQTVFMNDVCNIVQGTDAGITHKPYLDGDRGEIRGAYAFAKYLDTGEVDPEWMGYDKITEIRMRAPSKNSPAWKNFPEEMARKMPLKRVCKRLPTEREIDLTDMDDRLSKQIEGVALQVEPAAIAAPSEAPINIVPPKAETNETAPVVAKAQPNHAPSSELFPAGG